MRLNTQQLAHFAKTDRRIDKQSWLLKKGVVFNTGYKRRWFTLRGNMLFYYKSDTDKDPIGVVILERCRVESSHREATQDHTFKLVFDGGDTRDYELAADTEDLMLSWMKAISEAGFEYLKAVVGDLQRRVLAAELAAGVPHGGAAPATLPLPVPAPAASASAPALARSPRDDDSTDPDTARA